LEDRGTKAIFVGYDEEHPADCYRFLTLNTRRIRHSRDYIWLNKLYGDKNNQPEIREDEDDDSSSDSDDEEIPDLIQLYDSDSEDEDDEEEQEDENQPEEQANIRTGRIMIVKTNDNKSDIYTKNVSGPTFEKHIAGYIKDTDKESDETQREDVEE
jgi:hypothetical protein